MRSLRATLVFALALSAPFFALTQDRVTRQHELQSVLILKVMNYIHWPANRFSANEFTLCLLGVGPLQQALSKIQKPQWRQTTSIVIKTVGFAEGASGFEACHALVLGERSANVLGSISSQAGLLTIGFGESFVPSGGILGIVVRDNKLSFDINLDAANSAGLKFEAPLLQLAHTVKHTK